MEFLHELSVEIFGTIKLSFYVAYFIFVLLGVLLSTAFSTRNRDVDSTHTPEKWSFSFMLQDNLLRILASLGVVFVNIRFGEEFFHVVPTQTGAIILGLCWDQVVIQIERLQQKARLILNK